MAGANNTLMEKWLGNVEIAYYRFVLLLFSALYFLSVYVVVNPMPVNEFLLPRTFFAIIPLAIAIASFVLPIAKKYLQELLIIFLMLATIHLIFFLFKNNFNTHFELGILTLILFSNLHITSTIFLVLYNVTVLGALEFMLISGDNKTGNPVLIFASVAVVMIFSVAYQLYRIRNTPKNIPAKDETDSASTPALLKNIETEFESLPVLMAVTDLAGNKITSTKLLSDFLKEKNIDDENLLQVLNEDEQLTYEMVLEKNFSLSLIHGCRLHFKKVKDENKCVWIFTNDNSAITSHASHEIVPANNFLESGNFALADVDDNGKIISANKNFADITGYRQEEISLLSFTDLLHPIDMLALQNLTALIRSEKRLMHKSGKIVYAQISCIEQKENHHLTLLIEDVTDIKLTQKELQTAKANVTSVIENTNDLIFSTDVQHRIIVINAAFKKHFLEQYEKHLSIGDDYKIKLPESEKRTWAALHDRVLKGEKIITHETIADDDGNKIYLEISLNPIAGDSNLITGVSYFARDVTQRMVYEREIIKAKEVAEEATNAKSQFLATMSHEIRTPLNGMLGMLELLRTTSLNNKQREYVNTIKLSGESLMSIINDVLDFSKIESDKMTLEEKPFNLRKVVEETFDVFYYRSLEKQLELFYSVDSNIPPAIIGDSVRLKQVLINLVGNALKFTQKGHILMKAELANVTGNNFEIKFSVKDTGIGISKENIENLFTAFTQADASTYRKFGGTGLGLNHQP